MRYNVQIIRPNGEVETLRTGLEAAMAEAIARHPSNAGKAIVVPMFAMLPTGGA